MRLADRAHKALFAGLFGTDVEKRWPRRRALKARRGGPGGGAGGGACEARHHRRCPHCAVCVDHLHVTALPGSIHPEKRDEVTERASESDPEQVHTPVRATLPAPGSTQRDLPTSGAGDVPPRGARGRGAAVADNVAASHSLERVARRVAGKIRLPEGGRTPAMAVCGTLCWARRGCIGCRAEEF